LGSKHRSRMHMRDSRRCSRLDRKSLKDKMLIHGHAEKGL